VGIPGSCERLAVGAAAGAGPPGPATELMLDLTGISDGSRVLDLGAGTGGQTVLAARRVGPGGMVLATDISAVMRNLALEAAHAADLSNVRTEVMDAQDLALNSGSFDAMIVLAEVHRVLKAGGRFSVIVYSVEQHARRRAAAPPPSRALQTHRAPPLHTASHPTCWRQTIANGSSTGDRTPPRAGQPPHLLAPALRPAPPSLEQQEGPGDAARDSADA
jgi:SAM-dependent methyltransferase